MVTNSVLEYATRIDGLLPYAQLFDVVVDSCRVGMRKPAAAIFRRCLDLMELEANRVLFVDDQRGNIAAAAELGMRTLLAERFDIIASEVREHVAAWVADESS